VYDGQFGWRKDFGWFCVDVRMLWGVVKLLGRGERERGTPPPSYPSLANVIDRDVEKLKKGTRRVELEEILVFFPTS